MIYRGLNYNYPFPIPDFTSYTINYLSYKLGVKMNTLKGWEDDSSIPTRSRTWSDHDSFWTPDEMREAFIKSTILMRRGVYA